MALSNNQDREKILVTVAATVFHFTEKYPEAIIYAVGSTSVRTRKLNKNISDIKSTATDVNRRGFSKDPYVKRKNEMAREMLKKAGIPEEFKTKKKK